MAINFRTYTNDFSDSKYKEVDDIRSAQEGTDYLFDFEERELFNEWAIDLSRAKELGKLLLMVKKAEATKTEDKELWETITAQKTAEAGGKPTLVYSLINGHNERADAALKRLARFFKTKDLPKTKEERQNKIKDLEGQKYELVKKQADLEPLQKYHQKQLIELQKERETLKAGTGNTSGLEKVLRSTVDDSSEIVYNGTKTKLSGIKITIPDYANPGLSTTGGLFSVDNSGNFIDPAATGNTTDKFVRELVNYANSFLDEIPNIKLDINKIKQNVYATELDDEFVDEKYTHKQNKVASFSDIGYCYLRVLRDVGAENLKKVVESRADLSSSVRSKMKNYAEELVEFIHRNEPITNDLNNSPLYISSKKEQWPSKYDEWHKKLLKRKINEFPYRSIPDFEKLFEFMKTVFPAETAGGSANGAIIKLRPQTYLDDYSNSLYLKPKKSDEVGWEGLTLGGTYKRLEDVTSDPKYKTMVAFANSSDNTDDKLRYQVNNPAIISKDKSFKAVTLLWWKSFATLMNNRIDTGDNSFKIGHRKTDYLVTNDADEEGARNEIRYCKTIKAILKELGLLEKDDIFDSFLLTISDAAKKGSWINPRQDLLKEKWQVAHFKNENIYQLVKDRKVWTDEYDYKKFGKLLTDLSRGPLARLAVLEMEIERHQGALNDLTKNDIGYQIKIDDLNSQIAILKELDDFDDKPLPDKESDFDKLYKKRDSQEGKWTRSDLGQMTQYLEKIKEAMQDDAEFENKYKTKQDEVNGILTWLKDEKDGAGKELSVIDDYWEPLIDGDEIKGSLSEAIKKMIKDKDILTYSLESIRDAYKKIAEKILLSKKEDGYLKEVEKAIINPDDYKDKPPSDLTEEKLTELFAFNADKTLKDQWSSVDTKTITESNLKSWVTNDYSPTKSKHNDLLGHLSEHGDGLEGQNKTDYKISTEDEKKATWELFIKKGPEVVIKTIVAHEFDRMDDTKKKEVTDRMDNKKDGNDQPLDKSKYGDDEKWTDSGIKKFLYEEKIGKTFEFKAKEERRDDENGNGKPEVAWWNWERASGKILWIGVATVVLIGGLCAIFWKQISDWWNGPTEEEGIGAEGSDEEETKE